MLDFVAMMGNVKAFILSICSAVLFTTLLVSANTMAMSIRERTREVLLLKTLGFTRPALLGLFVSQAIALAVLGGIAGSFAAWALLSWFAQSPQLTQFLVPLPVSPTIVLVAIAVAGLVGFLSAVVPSYYASRTNTVDGIRHIG